MESGLLGLIIAVIVILLVASSPVLLRAFKIGLILITVSIGVMLILIWLVLAVRLFFLPWGVHIEGIVAGDLVRPVATAYYTPTFLDLYGWYVIDAVLLFVLIAHVLVNWLGKGAVTPLALIFVGIVLIFITVVLVDMAYAGISVLQAAQQGFSIPEGVSQP